MLLVELTVHLITIMEYLLFAKNNNKNIVEFIEFINLHN